MTARGANRKPAALTRDAPATPQFNKPHRSVIIMSAGLQPGVSNLQALHDAVEGRSGKFTDKEEDKEEDQDNVVVVEEVNIEFEAYSISDNDHDRIKKLLQQLFLRAPVNTAELTDLLIQQNHIGSVIKQTNVSKDSDDDDVDEDEIFGFISLLNLTERKGTQCADQIKELVLSFCEKNCEKRMVEKLDKLLNDTTKPVGFLLSERFTNVPPQVAMPMHQQLPKELAESHKTNKPCGKSSFYLLISKTFVEARKSDSKERRSNQKDKLMFVNAEEEFFCEKAVLKFNYSVQEESDTCLGVRWSFDDIPMKPLQTMMLIPESKMSEIMDKLKYHLSIWPSFHGH
ncbi:BRCA2 and CDKN1A-interacting protein-like [Marmota monax]|uniref:BRCA2 and CDKN1A-interacting protein-like n=1 Tax=Marmota monax TaxID=9995 RepID=UPI001EB04533|nr:BRCA2 and CDKN1A-interacting protein-like [Marmota monax]